MIEKILDRLDKVTKTGRGYVARCPAHEDKKPSLSVTESPSGLLLLFCHAGCTTDSILSAIDLTWKDLYPDESRMAYAKCCDEGAREHRKFKSDPETHEKLILELAKTALDKGQKLSMEDEARVRIALDRLT